MNLTPAQQQLSQLSLRQIMGDSTNEDDFNERLSDLASKIWAEFLDEEINHLLSDSQIEELGVLLTNEETTEEQFSDFLNDAVPNFEEMYQEKILDNKAIIVEGRIQHLRNQLSGESEKEILLDDCDDLINKDEWLQVQGILSTEFAEY